MASKKPARKRAKSLSLPQAAHNIHTGFYEQFSQAKQYCKSESATEKQQIVEELSRRLEQCASAPMRENMLQMLAEVNKELADSVAYACRIQQLQKHTAPVVSLRESDNGEEGDEPLLSDEALTSIYTIPLHIRSRRVAILAAAGVNGKQVLAMKKALTAAGAVVEIIAPVHGSILTEDDLPIGADHSFQHATAAFYDAVYVPGGERSVQALQQMPYALHFLNDIYKHCKAIAAHAQALPVLEATYFCKQLPVKGSAEQMPPGILLAEDTDTLANELIAAIARHRFWERNTYYRITA
ncbi:hypothetical protein HNQ91_003653 [Filimonas zeae]|uniref:catalase n=1 Tax=Filimonas zeae TaxID=1737353 RepID=A0A917J0N6_9BACT|nr:DJ-1/PfpI family protein [Filimonas zeae]MDR6340588.1 hypothetical protein [Filimonas zeae]GGH73431.1 hypothetical protein GCM10011379_34940 [Filimonas zeae]